MYVCECVVCAYVCECVCACVHVCHVYVCCVCACVCECGCCHNRQSKGVNVLSNAIHPGAVSTNFGSDMIEYMEQNLHWALVHVLHRVIAVARTLLWSAEDGACMYHHRHVCTHLIRSRHVHAGQVKSADKPRYPIDRDIQATDLALDLLADQVRVWPPPRAACASSVC